MQRANLYVCSRDGTVPIHHLNYTIRKHPCRKHATVPIHHPLSTPMPPSCYCCSHPASTTLYRSYAAASYCPPPLCRRRATPIPIHYPYAAVMWYFWVVPFFYVVRKIIIDDPYEIIYKLKTFGMTVGMVILLPMKGLPKAKRKRNHQVQTFGMTVGMLIFLPIAFFLEPVIGTSHHGLLSFEAFIWYSECWLPLVLTWKKLEENAKIDAASQKYSR
eukprot:1365212-Amorphochlora_amoeboformis.AAC.1